MRLIYLAPTRGLLGFRYQFLTATRGMGVMHTIFHGYDAHGRRDGHRAPPARWSPGKPAMTTTYGLKNAEERGTLFIGPGVRSVRGHGDRRDTSAPAI